MTAPATLAPARKKPAACTDPALLRAAVIDSFVKLDPTVQIRNPVMFVVFIGAILTTIACFGTPTGFNIQVTLWLWFTVLFANFAEAIAEGRGKAQAATLRKMRTTTMARLLLKDGEDSVMASELRKGDLVVCEAGDIIPSDGDVVEGIASVDESAITGESAPVIRESGGDHSAVTGGTRVISDRIVIKITSEPGNTFLDRMITMVESATRGRTPNEIALGILLVSLTFVFLLAVGTLRPLAQLSERLAGQSGVINVSLVVLVCLTVCLIPTTIGALLSAIGISGIDRMIQRNVLATSGRAVEAAGDIDVLLLDKTGTITLGNRQAAAFIPAPGVEEKDLAAAAHLASMAAETPEGRSIVVLAKERFNLRARPGRVAPQRRRAVGVRVGAREWRCLPGSRRAIGRVRLEVRRHAARRRGKNARAWCRAAQGRRQRRHPRAFRAAPQNGHPHRDDHRRQSDDRRRHRRRGGRR